MSHDTAYVLKSPVRAYRVGSLDGGVLKDLVGNGARFVPYPPGDEFDGYIWCDGDDVTDVNMSDMLVLFGDGDWDVYSDTEFNSLFTLAPKPRWTGFIGD